MKWILFLLSMAAAASSAPAQVNGMGKFQFGLGLGLGVHATHFEQEAHFAGYTLRDSQKDDAITVTVPLEAQVGLSDDVSVGLYLEPGSYLDSADAHPNKLILVGLSPRLYVVNKDRFALHLNADVGFSHLRISGMRQGAILYNDRYAGGHFRLGIASQWFFGNAVGIHIGLKYADHSFNWKERDPAPWTLNIAQYYAKLKTSGVQFQVGFQVKI